MGLARTSTCERACSVEDVTSVFLNEPLLGVLISDLLEFAESVSLRSASGHSLAGSAQHDVEVHAENTSVGIVLNSKIDMLVNTKSEVAIVGEVLLAELEFLHTEAASEQLFGLVTAHGAVDGNFFVSTDAKASNCVPGLRLNGLLVSQGGQHLSGLGELITRLTSAQVKNEFLNLDLPHLIVVLFLLLL